MSLDDIIEQSKKNSAPRGASLRPRGGIRKLRGRGGQFGRRGGRNTVRCTHFIDGLSVVLNRSVLVKMYVNRNSMREGNGKKTLLFVVEEGRTRDLRPSNQPPLPLLISHLIDLLHLRNCKALLVTQDYILL